MSSGPEQDERRHSRSQRILQAVGGFVGTATFVGLQLLAVARWLIVNADLVGIVGPLIHTRFRYCRAFIARSCSAYLLRVDTTKSNGYACRPSEPFRSSDQLTGREGVDENSPNPRQVSRHFQFQQIEDPETAELRKETTERPLVISHARCEEMKNSSRKLNNGGLRAWRP